MNSNLKIAAIALVASLVGGSAGAALSSWKTESATTQPPVAAVAPEPAAQIDPNAATPTDMTLPDEQLAPAQRAPQAQPAYTASARRAPAAAPAPARATRSSSQRQVYYDYGQPRASSAPSAYTYRDNPSFWDKHRDKLTVGIGTGAGALIGGIAGGKKGAAIGALAGAGGSALYTYKIRKRNGN